MRSCVGLVQISIKLFIMVGLQIFGIRASLDSALSDILIISYLYPLVKNKKNNS